MALINACDSCKAYGLPNKPPAPGTITPAEFKTPVILRTLQEDGTYKYEIRELDSCDEHNMAFTQLHLRMALALPDENLVTGWEPEDDLDELLREDGKKNPMGEGESHDPGMGEKVGPKPGSPEALRADLMSRMGGTAPKTGTKVSTANDSRWGHNPPMKEGSAPIVRKWAAENDVTIENPRGAIPGAVKVKFLDADPTHERYFDKVKARSQR